MPTDSGSLMPMLTVEPPLLSLNDDEPSKKDLIIGGSLAICGNLMISIAMNIQKYALMQLIRRGASEDDYTKSRLWWFGIVLMVIGEIGNFLAYGFAPATTVAPLGTTTVLANAYIASLYLGEKVRRQDLLGTLVILVGVFLILTFSTSKDIRLDADQLKSHLVQWSFIFYLVVEAVVFATCIYLVKVQSVRHVALYLLPAAILASLTIIGAKAVSSMLDITLAGDNQLVYPIFYFMILLMVVTGVIQIRYVTKAMQEFDSTVVVPTNFVFFTISAILAGIFFYQEFMGLTYLQVTMFLYGCFFCFFGVGLIAEGRESDAHAHAEPTEATTLQGSRKIKQKTKDLVQKSDFSKHKVQPEEISTQSSLLERSSSDEGPVPSPTIIFHFEMNQEQDQQVKGSKILFNPDEEIDSKTSREVERAVQDNKFK